MGNGGSGGVGSLVVGLAQVGGLVQQKQNQLNTAAAAAAAAAAATAFCCN